MMKYSFYFLFMLIPVSLFSQKWCQEGSTWKYSYENAGQANHGYVEIKYSKDTLVNGVNANKLIKKAFLTDDPRIPIKQWDFGFNLTYEKNGVVYLQKDTQWDTLYNFNSFKGDHWSLSTRDQKYKTGRVVVTDTGSISINGKNLKYRALQIYCDSSNVTSSWFRDTIIEGIGAVVNYLLLDDICLGKLDGNEGGEFRCFSSNTFPTYKPRFKENCDFVVGISQPEIKEYKIYNNSEEVILEGLHQLKNYAIYSMEGKLVLSGSFVSNRIKISELTKGVYILGVQNEKNEFTRIKFIK